MRYAGCPNKTAKHVVSQLTLAQDVATSASVEKGALIASSPIAVKTVVINPVYAYSMVNNLSLSSRITIARGPAKIQNPQMRCLNKTTKHMVSQLTLAQGVVVA